MRHRGILIFIQGLRVSDLLLTCFQSVANSLHLQKQDGNAVKQEKGRFTAA